MIPYFQADSRWNRLAYLRRRSPWALSASAVRRAEVTDPDVLNEAIPAAAASTERDRTGHVPRTVQVLVDRAPTNMQVRKERAGAYCPDLVLCVDQDSGFIYHHELLHPDDGKDAVLAVIGRDKPGARVIWVARQEQVATALATRFGEADVWSESRESFGLWDEAYTGMDRQLGSGRGVYSVKTCFTVVSQDILYSSGPGKSTGAVARVRRLISRTQVRR